MAIIIPAIFGFIAVYLFVVLARVEVVSNYVDARIKEVFASQNWHKYPIDIEGAYNSAMWDFRKWTYKDFFPEDVK